MKLPDKHAEPMNDKNIVYCNSISKSISFKRKMDYNKIIALLGSYEEKYGFYLVEE